MYSGYIDPEFHQTHGKTIPFFLSLEIRDTQLFQTDHDDCPEKWNGKDVELCRRFVDPETVLDGKGVSSY
jgi:hypothetical protein